MKSWIVGALIALTFMGSLVSAQERPRIPWKYVVGDDFVYQTLPSLGEGELDFSDYKGKTLLLNFFASWCGPCRAEAPHLEAYWKTKKEKGLVVIGINLRQNSETAESFVKKHKLSFPVALDRKGTFFNRFGQRGIPTNILIRPDGTIAYIKSGFDKKEFGKLISEVLSNHKDKKR